MAKELKDVKMMYIEDDIGKIQTKTNLYLKSYGSSGALHLVKEVVQNGIDESSDPNSPGHVVRVSYDIKEDALVVEDDGRGFPETDYPLEIFCTKLQSGSKFMRDDNTDSAGEFGIGLTAVCALSTTFILTSYREKEGTVHKLVFHEGTKVEDLIENTTRGGKRHGSYVKFIPSKKFLGPTTKIPHEELERWIDDISYQLSEDVVIEYTLTDGLDVVKTETFKKRDPLGLLEKICTDQFLFRPTKISSEITFEEDVINMDRSIDAHTVRKGRSASYLLMFAYDDSAETIYDSYCNFANTTEGGVHLDGAETSLCRYLQLKTKESMTDREKDKMDILWSDVRSNLKMIVMLNTNANVQFVGNAKEKIASTVLAPILKDGFYSAICSYFDENADKLKLLVKIIKMSAKVRVEANKIREASTKENMNSLKEHLTQNYIPCSNTGNQYKEIFVLEGLSPQGGAGNARDTHSQALLAFRGVTANPFKQSLTELMHPTTGNVEFRRLVSVLRCGIGSTFNLSKLYFDKIIIMTDADIDGAGISASLSAFFLYRMPEIVEAGKLYKVVPPLYKLDDKNTPYVRTKREMVEVYQDKIIKNHKIAILKYSKDLIPNSEFKEFIYETSEYLKNLNNVADHFNVNKFLVEKIIAFIFFKYDNVDESFDIDQCFKDQRFITELMSYIQEEFPEVEISGSNTTVIRGVIEGKYQSILVSSRFLRKCIRIFPVIRRYGYALIVSDDNRGLHQMSIGRFLEMTQKYVSKILIRYKGIGEMKAIDLMNTTMNPDTRMLIQLTLDDLKNDIKTFEKLFGDSLRNKNDRKKMMKEFIIDREDLDN